VPEFLTLHEIAKEARRRLPQTAWDYLTGGCETETTLRRNRAAIDSLAFRPRVLRDVNDIDLTSSFLGRKCRIPVLLAPIGALESFDPGAAATVAKAAKEFGTTAFLSSVTQPGMEEVAAVGHDMVFQLYVRGDDAWVDDYVRRAEKLGCTGFCLTVDTQVYSRRERDLIKRYVPVGRRTVVGRDWQAGMTWDLVKRLKGSTRLPLILKGIATAEDTHIAVEHGVDVVYVSNHGGRQLDHGLGAIDVLPEVVQAAGGKAPVVVDSGFLRGSDVI
jgi:glycolate oxidase